MSSDTAPLSGCQFQSFVLAIGAFSKHVYHFKTPRRLSHTRGKHQRQRCALGCSQSSPCLQHQQLTDFTKTGNSGFSGCCVLFPAALLGTRINCTHLKCTVDLHTLAKQSLQSRSEHMHPSFFLSLPLPSDPHTPEFPVPGITGKYTCQGASCVTQ